MQPPPDLDAIKHVFWDRSATYKVQPALTEAMLEHAEQTLRVRLPRLYVELLRVQNGGVTASEFTAFPTQQATLWADDHVPFGDMRGIGVLGTDDPERSILENAYYVEEWEIDEGLVLLTGDGHWWIALDYRESGPRGEPSVCWVETEEADYVELAPSFEDFVRGLRPEADFDDEDDAWDPDHPPEPGALLPAALSGSILGLETDLECIRDRERSLANSKAWCAERTSFVFDFLPENETASLRAALSAVEEAEDSDALAQAMQTVIRELDALIPAWIEAKGPSYEVDYADLYERGELQRLRPPR